MSERQRSAAKRLRREMTPAERKLWYALRAHRFQDLHIRRQVPMGRYIADFACHANRVVIEVDGEQHGFDREAARDRARDAWFESQGYRVLRFANGQVLYEIESVLDTIYARLLTRPDGPSADAPSPPLWGRVGEGARQNQAPSRPEALTGYDNPSSSELPPLHTRRPPSALGLRPSRPSPTRGEGERGA